MINNENEHKGYGKSNFEHNYNRRKKDHDYTKPTTYHIILKKNPDIPDFGSLRGDPAIAPPKRGCAYILRSPLGRIIHEEIFKWPQFYPFLKNYQHIVMPDHVHILVRVTKTTDKKFSFYVNKLKGRIAFRWNELNKKIMPQIFMNNFTDKIIFPNRSLDGIFSYIRHNPHRLAVRKTHPEFFIRMRKLKIMNEEWEAYGNIFFMRNPFKEVVIVHRSDSDEDFHKLLRRIIDNEEEGGVTVSPFIAEREKDIRDALIEINGRIIHIQRQPFSPLFKPEKSRFQYCEMGKLLILAPARALSDPSERAQCLHLNRIAEAVANGDFHIG